MSGGAKPGFGLPDHVAEAERCKKFLADFVTTDTYEKKYAKLIQDVADRRKRVVSIDLDDVYDHEQDDDFVNSITRNVSRYIELFSKAIDSLMPAPTPGLDETFEDEVFDVLMRHRATGAAVPENSNPDDLAAAAPAPLPASLTRRYEVHIIPRSSEKPRAVRNISATEIGHLVLLKGIVTRCTQVKPMLTVATYTCDICGFEIYQEIKAKSFLPINQCPTTSCKNRGNTAKGKVMLQSRGSKFVKFQEVKLQETADQVPVGHIPRIITVHLQGELTRSLSPGDMITLAGAFLPTPFTGRKGIRAGLISDTYIEAMHVVKAKEKYSDFQPSEELQNQILAESSSPNMYDRLSQSIAPEIFGHADIKKALLLLLVGGVTKKMQDGMKIRGDINVCIVGDPGVAKSQLLKQVANIAPRGIYTTGKGSSGVGLTAAVLRDSVTNDLTLEGGALVLADLGVCCIDEFDKMEDGDRTAIHEVMEQQTVSIAKGGINTTLNARTSILAAANPLYGRYNVRRSPEENINLPAALLSRFDLLFLILDKPDEEADFNLATHVTYVHTHNAHPPLDADREVFDVPFIRAYIAAARAYEPYVPAALSQHIIDAYVTMRASEAKSNVEDRPHTYTSARTLLGILRISQALARLRFSEVVEEGDVDEAIRLMRSSTASIRAEAADRNPVNPEDAIYALVRAMFEGNNTTVKVSDILPRVLQKGYTQQQLDAVIEEYHDNNIWSYDKKKGTITHVTL